MTKDVKVTLIGMFAVLVFVVFVAALGAAFPDSSHHSRRSADLEDRVEELERTLYIHQEIMDRMMMKVYGPPEEVNDDD